MLNIPVGFVCTVAAKLRAARRLLRRREKAASAGAARRQALALHRAGLADAEDTQVRPGLRRKNTLWHRTHLHLPRAFR